MLNLRKNQLFLLWHKRVFACWASPAFVGKNCNCMRTKCGFRGNGDRQHTNTNLLNRKQLHVFTCLLTEPEGVFSFFCLGRNFKNKKFNVIKIKLKKTVKYKSQYIPGSRHTYKQVFTQAGRRRRPILIPSPLGKTKAAGVSASLASERHEGASVASSCVKSAFC